MHFLWQVSLQTRERRNCYKHLNPTETFCILNYPLSIWAVPKAHVQQAELQAACTPGVRSLTTAQTGLLHGPDVGGAVLTRLPDAHLVVCEHVAVVLFNLVRDSKEQWSPFAFKHYYYFIFLIKPYHKCSPFILQLQLKAFTLKPNFILS